MGIVRRLAIWELTSTSQRLGQKNKNKKSCKPQAPSNKQLDIVDGII